MDHVARFLELSCPVKGSAVTVKVTINASYEAYLEFNLVGTPYSFSVTHWGRRGFAKFAHAFFKHSERDVAQFGGYEESTDGVVTLNMTTEHKLNVVTQGVKDVMSCLNCIVSVHQRSVLDYAVWYCEHFPAHDSYESYITLVTCNCIVHTHFLAPNVTWQIVKFGATAGARGSPGADLAVQAVQRSI